VPATIADNARVCPQRGLATALSSLRRIGASPFCRRANVTDAIEGAPGLSQRFFRAGTDPSQSWISLTASDSNSINTDGVATALDVSSNGQAIIVGRSDYKLLISTSVGKSWSVFRLRQIVMAIVINPQNPDETFVATKYENDSKLLHVTGLQSRPNLNPPDIRGNLPPVDVVRIFSGEVLAGTENGVWGLSGNGTWRPVGQRLPVVSVMDIIRMNNDALIALTHGRGAWALGP
jgi:hypothetical protein